jgi:hypothetical protein
VRKAGWHLSTLGACRTDGIYCTAYVSFVRESRGRRALPRRHPNLLERKIKSSLSRVDELTIAFDYEGEVTDQDAQDILEKIRQLHTRALAAASATPNPARAEPLRLFATNLHKASYAFELDFFQYNLLRIVDDVTSVIKGSIELCPLVEICYFQKQRKGLAQIRVNNRLH